MMHQRQTDAAVWLGTQRDNLNTNERQYKLVEGRKVYVRLSESLAGVVNGKVNVQMSGSYPLLGWRTAAVVNAVAQRDKGLFIKALALLWATPLDPQHADMFWRTLEPSIAALDRKEQAQINGVRTRASVASYFLFLKEPATQPFYKPTITGPALDWLEVDPAPWRATTPGTLLAQYWQRCHAMFDVLTAAGAPLTDMLDLQGALYIIKNQYPDYPRRPEEPDDADVLAAEFQSFLDDPVQALRCAVRRTRAAALRDLLSAPAALTLDTFNREVWRFESQTLEDGVDITRTVYGSELTGARARHLQAALDQGRLELHGNYMWGSGAQVYGSRLDTSVDEKTATIQRVARLLSDPTLTALQQAQAIDAQPGFGPNASTGLVMLAHPRDFLIYNRPSQDALRALNYDVSTLEAFQTAAADLSARVNAPDVLTLDWFLYTRGTTQRFWWANQRQTYADDRENGYISLENAPERSSDHEHMLTMKPGDHVVHCVDDMILAVSTVIAPPAEVPDGPLLASVMPASPGVLVQVDYLDLAEPIPVAELSLGWHQPGSGPFDAGGRLLEGCCYPLQRRVYEHVIAGQRSGTAWILRGDGRFSEGVSIPEGESAEWTVPTSATDMQAGDHVVWWTSGPDAGLRAVGEVTGAPAAPVVDPAAHPGGGAHDQNAPLRVPVRVTRHLNPGLPRAVLETHPVLSQLQVLGDPAVPAVRLTPPEWAALEPLLVPDDVWKERIITVLSSSSGALTVAAITRSVLNLGAEPGGDQPERTVSRVLTANVDVFEAVREGTYRLRSGPPGTYTPVPFATIVSRVRAAGLVINERTLRRYHLALHTRGFVILSGVSGTGKTWLAEQYALAAHAEVKVIPVAPNWTSNEDLLGFYSPLEGGHYHHTAMSAFILEAGAEHCAALAARRPARPYHIILDEMNLARVEYYFAQFLSLMERRSRGAVPELELGPTLRAALPPNVVVIGTVNVDETTHDFADKVYDRAQLIELEVDREALATHLAGHHDADLILNIWDAMRPVIPFAFRILDEIRRYESAAAALGVSGTEALDDIVLQKILPKFRGTDPRLMPSLQQVVRLTHGRLPLSHAKASAMAEAGAQHGFISFH